MRAIRKIWASDYLVKGSESHKGLISAPPGVNFINLIENILRDNNTHIFNYNNYLNSPNLALHETIYIHSNVKLCSGILTQEM